MKGNLMRNALKSLVLSVALVAMSLPLYGAFNPWDFNVYTSGDIGKSSSPYQSDFQGIAGSAGSDYFSGFSLNLINQTGPQPEVSLYTQGNAVIQNSQIENGGIQARGNVNVSGSAVYGGVSSNGNFTGSNGTIYGNVTTGGTYTNQGGLTVHGSVTRGQVTPSAVNFSQVTSYFQNASNFWGNLTPTATANNNLGTLVVSPLSSGLNVLNLTLAQIAAATSMSISGDSSGYLVVNVTGTGTSSPQELKALSLNGFANTKFLYNILGISDLLLSSGGSYASILAPFSNVTTQWGLVTGNLVANNLYGSGQVNSGTFVGYSQLSTAVPEPSTYIVLATMLLGLGYLTSKVFIMGCADGPMNVA